MSQIVKLSDQQQKRHPFLEGLKNPPENRTKELKKIREWMEAQPHLPYISDEYIYMFLHACYYNLDPTKHALESYFTIRANAPSLFSNKDVHSEKLLAVANVAYLGKLPQLTPEGYRVLMYTLRDGDPALFNFIEVIKGFCMYNDCVLSEDSLMEGYLVVFDAKHIKFGHLARVSFPTLRAFMSYIQDAHPARLKGVHVINSPSFINQVMRLITPLIKSELIGLLKFHRGNLPEGIPQEVLPLEYGGLAPSIEELNKEMLSLREQYAEWFIESESFIADESKRTKKSSWWSIFNSNNENEIQNINSEKTEKLENPTFKNLSFD